MSMRDAAAAMRDSGRSWTEIGDDLRIPVPIAKAMVADARAHRRSALARTELSERARGLHERCAHCDHPRKDHPVDGPGCAECGSPRTAWRVHLPDREVVLIEQEERPDRPAGIADEDRWAYSCYREEVGCPGFESVPALAARRAADPGRRRGHLPHEAHRLGVVGDEPFSYWGRMRVVADMPRRRLITKVRRAQRREAAARDREA